MRVLGFVLAIICCAYALRFAPSKARPIINKELVDRVNKMNTTWTAGLYADHYVSSLTRENIHSLLGTKLKGGPKLARKTFTERVAVPDSFDSRTNWPKCQQMKVIRDQSACGSCWAFAAVEAMSDRECIFNNLQVSISAEDMNSCCDECGDGCGGGFPSAAWQYFNDTGVVDSKCRPYSLPSCDHHMANSTNPCPSDEYPTPPCVEQCEDGRNWENAKYFGAVPYSLSGEDDMKQEIYQNGPVETAFTVYADFLTYTSGVYQQTSDDELGGHAVKILGWGTYQGTPYWLCANSWNPHWGMQGYFMILRGQDECGIEDEIDAGIPLKV
jgi:cathepsin B